MFKLLVALIFLSLPACSSAQNEDSTWFVNNYTKKRSVYPDAGWH